MFVCVSVFVPVCVPCVWMRLYEPGCTPAFKCACVCAYVFVYLDLCVPRCVHAFAYACVCLCVPG